MARLIPITIEINYNYLDVSCVVCTVEAIKSLNEYPRKNAATLMDANTTPTHPNRSVRFTLRDKYFQPCKLVQLQNVSKLVQDRWYTFCLESPPPLMGGALGVDRFER